MSKLFSVILTAIASIGLVACVQVPSPGNQQPVAAGSAGTAEALFRERIVDCALPLLAKFDKAGVAITYRYQDGDTRIETDDLAFSGPLRRCATPEAGPRQTFSGKLTLWREATEAANAAHPQHEERQ